MEPLQIHFYLHGFALTILENVVDFVGASSPLAAGATHIFIVERYLVVVFECRTNLQGFVFTEHLQQVVYCVKDDDGANAIGGDPRCRLGL